MARERAASLDIDAAYFLNYAGSGKPYAKVWRDYTYFDECVAQFKAPGAPPLESVLVLGAATGEICKGFHRKFGVLAHGCEKSEWAHRQIPAEYRRRVKCADMRDYVKQQVARGRRFTLAYSNSLIYLPEARVPAFLKTLHRCVDYVHFRSSFTGVACRDPWRMTLRPYAWWNARFRAAGFRELKNAKGYRTYLWRV
jgi:hypothetical protein